MSAAILTQGLTKTYGRRLGIQALDLEVHPGEVFGFIGPNGAGKTTTIRLLLDLLHPTGGRAEILGLDSHRRSVEIRRSVGYLPGEFGLDARATGRQLLRGFAAFPTSAWPTPWRSGWALTSTCPPGASAGATGRR
jgi:ABC-2 type transport system ATP-binding protein